MCMVPYTMISARLCIWTNGLDRANLRVHAIDSFSDIHLPYNAVHAYFYVSIIFNSMIQSTPSSPIDRSINTQEG